MFQKNSVTLHRIFEACTSGRSAVGSAPGLGPGGRRFESCHPDSIWGRLYNESALIFEHMFSALNNQNLTYLGYGFK